MISDRPVNAEWLKGENKERISLTDELKLFAEYIKLDRTELATRELVVRNISECIQGIYPSAIVNPFGSYPLGLSIYSSDLDLSVDNVNTVLPEKDLHSRLNNVIRKREALLREREALQLCNQHKTAAVDSGISPRSNVLPDADAKDESGDINKKIEQAQRKERGELNRIAKPAYIMKKTKAFGLNPLAYAFQENRLVRSVKFVKGATVPLVKVSYRCGIQADLSWSSTSGLVVKSMVEQQGSALINLSLFLKVYLSQLKLDEVFTGGLGSYRLYVMISAHIARNPRFVKDPNNPNLGALLLSFLKYYSDPKLFQKKTIIQVPKAEPIKLPSGKLYEQLREVFKQAHTTLTETPHAKPKLHKLIDVDSIVAERKEASAGFADFLAEVGHGVANTNSIPGSSVIHTMASHGQHTKLSDPVLAPSTVGAVRAYRVSSRTNSLFACDCTFAGVLYPIGRSPCVPFAALRSKYPVGHWNSSVVYAAGRVFRKLCQLR